MPSIHYRDQINKGEKRVSGWNPLPVAFVPPQSDAFGRIRVGGPLTIFDSKQIHDNQPLFFDDSEVSGSGTGSSHDADRASTTVSVSATTAGKRVRQTFQRFNYQPGKSQLVLCTGVLILSGGGAGITAAMGYFDDDNGVFVEVDAGAVGFTVRSSVTGSAVDNTVTQDNWNGDKLDGTGESGLTLDASKAQIFWFDIEWLGVGSVRCGFVINGKFVLCHTFHHANVVDSVYMSTPNLPIRYEIENDGSGAASTLEHICSTVISEGGVENSGPLRYKSTAGTHVDANSANTIYAVIGLRLKSSHIDETVLIERITMFNQQAGDFEWVLLFNPTIAGTFTYSDETNSSIQTATGATANTVTGGTPVDGGMIKSTNQSGGEIGSVRSTLRLGSAIDGTVDELVLCVRPLDANADIEGSVTWRELN